MRPSPAPGQSTTGDASARDGLVLVDGEEMLRIGDVDRLPPFLMSVVSDSDHWMYVSSRGGLTAGRVTPDRALFPYVTDDKLHQCHPHTGPFTAVRAATPRGLVFWEPFRHDLDGESVRRNLYKSPSANGVVFEEIHHGLGLALRYRWETSEAFGFVRSVSVQNLGPEPAKLDVLDGLLDLMPAGVSLALQQRVSCLVNAYTRAEVDPETRVGLFALQALIVDQAVPAESLKATAVWCSGLQTFDVLLSTDQLAAFRNGLRVHHERLLKGRRGAYLVSTTLRLAPGEVRRWRILADVERDHLQVEALRARLRAGGDVEEQIVADVRRGTESLLRNVGRADGLQRTADRTAVHHHFANVLFNNMRGGVFVSGHRVPRRDFADFLRLRNRPLHERLGSELASWTGEMTVRELIAWANDSRDPDLQRLASEYLPLFFSRRHGDPSRPWNTFAIRLRKPDGTRALDYEGNWRDIFQNWEALCASHPDFLESVIATFVNASTADGFNPYRLSRSGMDWEVPEEGDPWSNIGYWGDHQIVYLTRLLEASARYHPGRLEALLGQRWFCFADVPYRLKPSAEIARDARATIVFDHARERLIEERVARLGGDGKLLHDEHGQLLRATLLEKLLVPVLAKLASLVLDGGIWMNTQRPEWNDANNALVGTGLSVVTLCHLRGHLAFLSELFDGAGGKDPELSAAVGTWLRETRRILEEHRGLLLGAEVSDEERRALLEALQAAFEAYRQRAYAADPGPAAGFPLREAAEFCRLALGYLDHTIRANRRADRLYHAYNLLELSDAPKVARIAPLYEMLEGQVAALGSGLLAAEEALALLDALFASRLFRQDQESFMLYPDRELPGFLEKNRVPPEDVEGNGLLAALLAEEDRSLVARDALGQFRFDGSFRTAADVRDALVRLGKQERFAALVATHGEAVVDCFVRVFDLKSFTGRSGTMFGYEGLGCIYWHMVSKLLLAVQEVHGRALREGESETLVRRLAAAYYRVRGGLGFNKTPREFGAFPTDPYSHTPRHSGAQQPGMTGQVKEEVLTRLGEVGVDVREGCIEFRPALLLRRELLAAPAEWEWFGVDGRPQRRTLAAGELGFTLCQTPIVYRLAAARSVVVRRAAGEQHEFPGTRLDAATSGEILGRSGAVAEVVVSISAGDLCAE